MKAANKLVKDAIVKRKDGIVEFNYAKLAKSPKAGEAAKKACPYYAIVEDEGGFYTDGTPVQELYEQRDFYENDKKLTRRKGALKGAIRKCTFCSHRLDSGMIPACVSTCIGRAMYFGDLNDPNSLVSELIKKEKPGVIAPTLEPEPEFTISAMRIVKTLLSPALPVASNAINKGGITTCTILKNHVNWENILKNCQRQRYLVAASLSRLPFLVALPY
ncbi:MAG: hypothetical protein K0B01_03625 [Syntrophobacterales bacterium]|nr:hypothetical protein [Syntrophobacterales bacterium]